MYKTKTLFSMITLTALSITADVQAMEPAAVDQPKEISLSTEEIARELEAAAIKRYFEVGGSDGAAQALWQRDMYLERKDTQLNRTVWSEMESSPWAIEIDAIAGLMLEAALARQKIVNTKANMEGAANALRKAENAANQVITVTTPEDLVFKKSCFKAAEAAWQFAQEGPARIEKQINERISEAAARIAAERAAASAAKE